MSNATTNHYEISYSYVAAASLYYYDYLLTLGGEVELIWKRRLTLPTMLYLLLRYLALVEVTLSIGKFIPRVVETLSCEVLLMLLAIVNFCSLSLISAIISFRTLALYNWTKHMVIILASINIGQTLVLTILIRSNIKFYSVDNGKVCGTTATSSMYLTSLWWIPLGVDTLLFVLTMTRLYWLQKRTSSLSPLLQVVGRDGVLYYMIICLVYLVNILNFTFNTGVLKTMGLYFGVAIPASTACRLTRNLQCLSTEPGLPQDRRDTNSEVFTTSPSRIGILSIAASVWLTGEQWGNFQRTSPAELLVQED